MTRKKQELWPGEGTVPMSIVEKFYNPAKNEELNKQTRKENSALRKARMHLDKETQRGEHSPKIAGHETSQHGGRVAQVKKDFKAADLEQSDPEAGWHNYTRNLK